MTPEPPPPTYADLAARVAALEHLIAQQAHALVAIETALGNVAGLSEADQDVIGWVRLLRVAFATA